MRFVKIYLVYKCRRPVWKIIWRISEDMPGLYFIVTAGITAFLRLEYWQSVGSRVSVWQGDMMHRSGRM